MLIFGHIKLAGATWLQFAIYRLNMGLAGRPDAF